MKICVIGLGYVGLPLSIALSAHHMVVGYDISSKRIEELKKDIDITYEVSKEDLITADVIFSNEKDDLAGSEVYIITVPTPVDEFKVPDLSFLKDASKLVGGYLNKGDLVIYESTVYPGVTEDFCLPILEKYSLLRRSDFHIGYSPERINPGDASRSIHDICKVISASSDFALEKVSNVYQPIIRAGLHRAPTIKVAEAAKVIENTQRDVNVALMNELSKIFSLLNINTKHVLEAAKTKWNFLPFEPGLVGGHCISVDPYYLAYKAKQLGYNPELIEASRRINDSMSLFVTNEFVKKLVRSGAKAGDKILVCGLTFKEDCPDTRNSLVKNILNELRVFGFRVQVYDPFVKYSEDAEVINIAENQIAEKFSGILVAVAHSHFRNLGLEYFENMLVDNGVLYDIKDIFSTYKSGIE